MLDLIKSARIWQESLMKMISFSEYGSRAQGWTFLTFGFVSFLLFLYTAVISKLLPLSDNPIIGAIQRDRYYCFLVPLLPPTLLVAVYFHWLTMKLYKHA